MPPCHDGSGGISSRRPPTSVRGARPLHYDELARVDSELELRWSAWLFARNRRGTRMALSIAVCLYPAFGVLDYLIAPRESLWLLYGTHAAVTFATIVLFGVVKSSLFARHPNAISASYMILISFGISLMTLFMGGLSSPYYAGLSLTLVATSLLFVWPVQVVVATHATIVLSFIIPNLIVGTSDDWLTAISNQFFLVSTAIIAGSGQVLAYRSQRELSRLLGDLFDLSKLEESRSRLRLEGRDHFSDEVIDRRGPWVDVADGRRESDGSLADWQRGTPKHFRLMDIDEATEQRLLERDSDENSREHTVLVVEDTPDVARVIRLALHHEFRFLAAGDGVQGLELARRHRPTIIITEWMMPKMDGIELTQRLRRDPETKHIPVVMLSARGLVEDKIKGLDAGVSAYLAKPFAASELVSTVRALLRAREVTADTLLTQKMDSLETIAGGLAHEINNPLNYLKNALASVERDCQTLLTSVKSAVPGPPESGVVEKLDSRIHKMFEVSRAGVDRIKSTVELMVRYSREGYSRSPRAYDAYAAVRDVARIVRLGFSPEAKVVIDLQGSGLINCVPEELNQVLTNLIQNALEAVPTDGTGQVVIRGREDDGHLVLSVKDNGPGIDERDRARVFDAFYTTKAVGHGMGMGLTISRRVVLAMGGSLSLKSQVGAGAEFSIRVPRLAAVEAAG